MQSFRLLFFCLFGVASSPLFASDSVPQTEPPYRGLSTSLVRRAEADLERIRPLVAEGTLPQSRLHEAEEHLADVQDDQILASTLYAPLRIEDMTDEQGAAMLAAAKRRAQRQNEIVERRQGLLDAGILAPAELEADKQELQSRQRVLQLAENRRRLVEDLRQMALTEERLQEAASLGRVGGNQILIKFDGTNPFNEAALNGISSSFAHQFGHPLPISAMGQTAVHESLGLDHRNRVDVALNPDSPEGLWLRGLLQRRQIPYLAFRSAVPGSATGPHIHIGAASSHFRPVQVAHAHG